MRTKIKKSFQALAGMPSVKTFRKFFLSDIGVACICALLAPVVIALFISAPFIVGAKYAILYSFGFNGKVSGRMDGNVLMRNGRGRGMTVPALVRNSYTSLQRGFLSAFSAGWRALSGADQLSWINFSYTKSDRFAQSYKVSGKQAYIALNQNLANITVGAIATAPAQVGALDELISGPTVAGGVMSYQATNLDPNSDYIVYATAPLSAGVYRPGASAFRLLGIQPAPALGVVTITTLYTDKFGSFPPSSSKVFLYTVAINNTTGENSAGSAILGQIAS